MSFGLSSLEYRARARNDMRMGVPLILHRGGVHVIVLAAETAAPERLAYLRQWGEIDLALTAWRAEVLKIQIYDDDLARIRVPGDASLEWVRASADPALDLSYPMKGPYQTRRGGDVAWHRAALQLCKEAFLLPAALVSGPLQVDALPEGVTRLEIDDALFSQQSPDFMQVSGAPVPLAVSHAARVSVYRPDDGAEEHYAIEFGVPARDAPVLLRMHSACFTGDVLGSLKCDCGPQLNAALQQIAALGEGLLLYLNQEGRGIGLANKMRAYSLQEQGFDTVEANHRLGFEDDERNFEIGANILKKLGFSQVRLLTNNPRKVAMLEASGIAVTERVSLEVGRNTLNDAYLRTKADKSGHLF